VYVNVDDHEREREMPTEEPGPGTTAADQFHIGIVVDDPQATMSQLSAVFGYEWGERMGGQVPVSLPTGDVVVSLAAWYSLSTPRLEIVQSIPDSLWSPVPGSGIHHLGYWTDDVATSATALEGHGYTVEAMGKRPGGEAYWAYLGSPSGPRIELVSRKLQPTMESYFATGKVPS
jgi:hypothetical protein